MLKRIWIKFSDLFKSKDYHFLSEILSYSDNREILLGTKRVAPPTPEQVTSDINRVIAYSSSQDYAVWNKEAWSQALMCLDKILEPGTKEREIDFYRGALKQTFELMRIAYKARFMRDDSMERSKKQQTIYPDASRP